LPRIKKAGSRAPAAPSAAAEPDPDEGIPFENYAAEETTKKATPEPRKAAAPAAETTVGQPFDDDPIGLY
jgi:hypothetical protein